MAKGRLIPTMLNQSSRWGRLKEFDRYLFTYIIVHADDQGRMHAAPAFVKSKTLPWNSAGVQEVSDALTRLEMEGYIILYEHGRNELLQIVDWWEMQSLSWAQPSQLSSPDRWVDRVRYQNGGQILKKNWKMCGGFTQDLSEQADDTDDEEVEDDRGIPEESNPLDSHLRSDLPSRLDNPQTSPLPSDLISPQGSILVSPQGSGLDSPQDSSLDSPQGSDLDSPQGSDLDSPQGSSLDSPQGSSLDSAQGSPIGSSLGSGIKQNKLNKIKPKKNKKTTTSKKVKVSTKKGPPGEKPPDGAKSDVVVAVVDDLPKSVIDQLALLGWADGYGEVKRAYGRDPTLVTVWLEHTLASDLPDNIAAGYFRNRLREGEMPPKKIADHEKRTAKYRASIAKYGLLGNDDEIEQLHHGGNGKTPHPPPDIPEEHQTVWQMALDQLQRDMPKSNYDTWVKDTQLISTEEDTFTLATMNEQTRDWLEDRLKSTLTRFLTGARGCKTQVEFVVREG